MDTMKPVIMPDYTSVVVFPPSEKAYLQAMPFNESLNQCLIDENEYLEK